MQVRLAWLPGLDGKVCKVEVKPTYHKPKQGTKRYIEYGLNAGYLRNDMYGVVLQCAIEHGRRLTHLLFSTCMLQLDHAGQGDLAAESIFSGVH